MEDASKETFDVALLDGRMMRLALREETDAREKKKDEKSFEVLNNGNGEAKNRNGDDDDDSDDALSLIHI